MCKYVVTISITGAASDSDASWIMGLIHLTRVFTIYVGDTSHCLCSCVRGIELYVASILSRYSSFQYHSCTFTLTVSNYAETFSSLSQ